MALISLQNVSIGFTEPLLDDISLQIDATERICLLGRNGSGKTTLMKLIGGEIRPDRGQVARSQGLQMTRLAQEVPQDLDQTVMEVVTAGLGDLGTLLAKYQQISQQLTHAVTKADQQTLLKSLEMVGHALDAGQGWEIQRQVEMVQKEMKLPGQEPFNSLSSGLKRRTLLARALICQPDLLMLDEPTNHLDIEAIAWLEVYLKQYPKSFLLVTHDRQLVRRLATRIIEVDLGRLLDWHCDYDTFLKRKEESLSAEAMQNKHFDKRLSEEETWIRQGVKARRTRNEGRVKALLAMREERRARRERQGPVRMTLQSGDKSGSLVLKAENLSYQYDEKSLIEGFSITIMRGDRIGIMGSNGCGKTTLIRLLLGETTPHCGTVTHGTKLKVIYFDQLRQQLDDDKSVWENVADGNDRVLINGKPQHVIGYLQRFLFSPERAHTRAGLLSGGERGRLLLARMFTRPCNLLVLDEPTNDLDIETLELLEELLLEFKGTILLVSHDRAFLNNVVTSTLVFENEKGIQEYIGGYDDWLWQRTKNTPTPPVTKAKNEDFKRVKLSQKLSYKEERELASLPEQIELLEAEKERLIDKMSKAEFYRQSSQEINDANMHLQSLISKTAIAYERWQALEEKQKVSGGK